MGCYIPTGFAPSVVLEERQEAAKQHLQRASSDEDMIIATE